MGTGTEGVATGGAKGGVGEKGKDQHFFQRKVHEPKLEFPEEGDPSFLKILCSKGLDIFWNKAELHNVLSQIKVHTV